MWGVGESSLGTQRQTAGPWQGPSPSGAQSWWVCHCLCIHCCGEVQWKDGHILVYNSKRCLLKDVNSLQCQLEVQPLAHMCICMY